MAEAEIDMAAMMKQCVYARYRKNEKECCRKNEKSIQQHPQTRKKCDFFQKTAK